MRHGNTLRLPVVDRAGLPQPSGNNHLALANRPNQATEARGVPGQLANLFGDEMSVNLTPQKSAIPRMIVWKTDTLQGNSLAIEGKTNVA